jgi:hypothetical protein
MGANQSSAPELRARQMAARGQDKAVESLAERGRQAAETPQGVLPGLESENVLNPSVGVPGTGRQTDAFAELLARRRGMG